MRPSSFAGVGPSKKPKAWRAVLDRGLAPEASRSPTSWSMALAAAGSGAREVNVGIVTLTSAGRPRMAEAPGPGSGPVAASSIWRLIRAAGSDADRAMEVLPAYAIGGVAMFWVIQRVAAFGG